MWSRPLISTIGVSRRTASRIWLPGATTGFDLTGEHAGATRGCSGCRQAPGTCSPSWARQPALGRAFTARGGPAWSQPRGSCSRGAFFKGVSRETRPSWAKQIRLDSTPYQVIGVLPRWFTYPDARVQLWVPYASTFTPQTIAAHDDASEPCDCAAQARGKRTRPH